MRRGTQKRAKARGEVLPERAAGERGPLDASRRVMELFVARGTTNISIRELAAHAGISERTFYRYFPRKEDAIRPSVDEGIAQLAERIRTAARDRPLREVVEEAYASAFEEHGTIAGWTSLRHIFEETESLRATWLQIVTDGERAIGAAMAERLGVDPASHRARLAGALVVTAARSALDAAFESRRRVRPRELLAESLDWLSPLLFEGDRPARARRRR